MSTAPESPSRRAKDNERPLVEDIRLLGRILGDVIREQEGDEAFELVERIRKLSVAFRRDADHEAEHRHGQPDVDAEGVAQDVAEKWVGQRAQYAVAGL